MYTVNEDLMNRITMVVGQHQNSFGKLNGGQIKEVVKLVINALCTEILGQEHQPITENANMKKAAGKKTKPVAKPKPVKKGK